MSDEIDAPYAIDLTSLFEALDTGIDISQIDYVDGNDDTHVGKAGSNTIIYNSIDSRSMDNNGDNVLMSNTGNDTYMDNTGDNTQMDNTVLQQE